MNPIVLAICFRDAGGSQQPPGRETPKCHLGRGRDCLESQPLSASAPSASPLPGARVLVGARSKGNRLKAALEAESRSHHKPGKGSTVFRPGWRPCPAFRVEPVSSTS